MQLQLVIADPSVRDSVAVLRILETRGMSMHPADYREAALHLMGSMRNLRVGELLALVESSRPVVCEAAEDVLFELGADDLVDDGGRRSRAWRETAALLHRL